MEYYNASNELNKAYENLINLFKKENIKLKYGQATTEENEELIAKEIYTHFGTHYYKCINSLNEMYTMGEYNNILTNLKEINIIDIGCSVGTASYAYIDYYLQNNNITTPISINIIFIEMSAIRVKYLKKMFDIYLVNVKSKNKNIKIKHHIINKPFPVNIENIKSKLINDAPILVFLSNFIHWNESSILAKNLNELFNIRKNSMYILNIETNSKKCKDKINEIINYMKKYRIYDFNNKKPAPTIRNNFNYKNLKASHWKSPIYKYINLYYETIIKEENFFINIINKDKLTNSFYKALNTLNNNYIIDEIEVNYFINNKMNIVDLAQRSFRNNFYNLYNNNWMEYKVLKKSNEYRPLVVEDGLNEIISTNIITTLGYCIDALQNENNSFGNRLNLDEDNPYIFKNYMKQYFNSFIDNQKKIKQNNSYKYFCKLDLKSYYTTIEHNKLKESIDNFLHNNTWFTEEKWLNQTVKNYINRGTIKSIGFTKGIPQGLPLSGVLSNMYLISYDKFFQMTFKEDTIFRYVDDIVIFSNKEINKNNCTIYTKYLEENLNLQINDTKSEFGSIESLQFYDLDENYNLISSKTGILLVSIYSLPSDIYKIYIASPKEFLSLMHEALKMIGIYIPINWLAKKVRKRNSSFSGIKINWGKMFGKKILNTTWKKDFLGKNIKFISELNELNYILEKEFNQVYFLIRKENTNKLILRKFKFLFNKLGLFTNENLINDYVFNYLKDKPWLVDLKRLRAYNKLNKLVIKSINDDYNDYCNLLFIWLIGEYEDKNNIKFIEGIFMESLKKSTEEYKLVNTIACISLLKLKVKNINIENIKINLQNMLKTNIKDYIYIRNMLVLINILDSDYLLNCDILKNLNDDDMQLNEFIKWIKNNANKNVIELVKPMYEPKDGGGIYLPEEPPGAENYNSGYI